MTAMTGVAIVATLAIIPALSVLYREFLDGSRPWASAASTVSVAVSSAGVWLLTGFVFPTIVESPLFAPTAALAALAGFLATLSVRDRLLDPRTSLGFSIAWSAIVFAPVALFSFFPGAIGQGPTASPTDHGGSILVNLTAGSTVLAIIISDRHRQSVDRSHGRPRSWTLVASGFLVWAAWTGSLVALELAIDELTSRIVINCVVAPLVAMIGWLVIQRIMLATTTVQGAVAGLVCGLVAVSAGAAVLDPLFAGVIGAIAGVTGCLLWAGRVRMSGHTSWFIVPGHLLAGMIGVLLIGPFHSTDGFIYTGQTQTGLTQLSVTALVVVWASVLSLALWPMARWVSCSRLRRGPGSSPPPRLTPVDRD